MEEKKEFKELMPDICNQLHRSIYIHKNKQKDWNQSFDESIKSKWNLGTFSKNGSEMMRSDLDILHRMINEKQSFVECLSDHYGSDCILGSIRTDEHMDNVISSERINHEKSFDIWRNENWIDSRPDKYHLNEEGEYAATHEDLVRIESVLFGDSLSLMKLCEVTEVFMSEITPDMRGLQVLYSV